MNIKDILFLLGLALLTTWGLDRFVFGGGSAKNKHIEQISGQAFMAPPRNKEIKQLRYEIDYDDAKRSKKEVVTEIETDWAYLSFSSDGAALERLQFKRHQHGSGDYIVTIFPSTERDQKAFTVALQERTPYYFTLVNTQEHEESVHLMYEGAFGTGLLRKTFKIYKHMFKVDLLLELVSTGSMKETTMRILLPSPLMPNVKNDQISGIVTNQEGTIEKIPYAKISQQTGWWEPSIFGLENRYFIHTLLTDDNHCIERGYFNPLPENRLNALLESSVMKAGDSCTLSFYLGPKDEQAVAPIDKRLEETFEHSGILAPLSRLLLKLLNVIYGFVHNYGYAIIILTILMRLCMLPFTMRAEKTSKHSLKLNEQMDYLKKKYKNDPERMRMEQMELIKKHGFFSQFAGQLPLFLQFPIFIALNRVLSNSVELYQAPFVGWIRDLSAPDPYYILPILILVSMFFHALTLDKKQRSTMMIISVVLGAFSINFASGLLVYLIVSTLSQSLFQKFIKAA